MLIGHDGTVVGSLKAEHNLGVADEALVGGPPLPDGWSMCDEAEHPVALDQHPALVALRTGEMVERVIAYSDPVGSRPRADGGRRRVLGAGPRATRRRVLSLGEVDAVAAHRRRRQDGRVRRVHRGHRRAAPVRAVREPLGRHRRVGARRRRGVRRRAPRVPQRRRQRDARADRPRLRVGAPHPCLHRAALRWVRRRDQPLAHRRRPLERRRAPGRRRWRPGRPVAHRRRRDPRRGRHRPHRLARPGHPRPEASRGRAGPPRQPRSLDRPGEPAPAGAVGPVGVRPHADAKVLADRLVAAVNSSPVRIGDHAHHVTVTVGVAVGDGPGSGTGTSPSSIASAGRPWRTTRTACIASSLVRRRGSHGGSRLARGHTPTSARQALSG